MKRFVIAALFLSACDFRAITALTTTGPVGGTDPDVMMMSTGSTGPTGTTGPSGVPTPTLTGFTSVQARQGAGMVSIALTGSHLSEVTTVSLGGLSVAYHPLDDASASVSTNVGHGAAMLSYSLSLKDKDGLGVDVANALIVTAITSGPSGSDATGAGTPVAPYRSFTKALSVATAGDTVGLLAGSYSETAGEAFPVVNNSGMIGIIDGTANVPSLVNVVGAGHALTTLSGPGVGSGKAALILSGTHSISGLRVNGFTHGVLVSNGSVSFSDVQITGSAFGAGLYAKSQASISGDVTISGNKYGVYMRDTSQGTLNNVDIGPNGSAGPWCATGGVNIYLEDSATLNMASGNVHEGKSAGIRMESSGQLNLTNMSISDNGQLDPCSQQLDLQSGTTVLRNVHMFNGGTFGITLAASAGLQMLDNSLLETARYEALLVGGSSSVKVRDSAIRLGPVVTSNHVITVTGTPTLVDFGTPGSTGNNQVFFDPSLRNGSGEHGVVRDDRATCAAVPTWNGTTFSMCFLMADGTPACTPIHVLTGAANPLHGTVSTDYVACPSGPTGCLGNGYGLDVGVGTATSGCAHNFY